MKVYAYRQKSGGKLIFFDHELKSLSCDGLHELAGVAEIDIKPEKKVVQKKVEFDTFYFLHNEYYKIPRTAKNIVVYYDVEE